MKRKIGVVSQSARPSSTNKEGEMARKVIGTADNRSFVYVVYGASIESWTVHLARVVRIRRSLFEFIQSGTVSQGGCNATIGRTRVKRNKKERTTYASLRFCRVVALSLGFFALANFFCALSRSFSRWFPPTAAFRKVGSDPQRFREERCGSQIEFGIQWWRNKTSVSRLETSSIPRRTRETHGSL